MGNLALQLFKTLAILMPSLVLVTGQSCLIPSLCNSGPFNILGNPAGGVGCLLECALVCGPGSVGTCNSYQGNSVYTGPDLDSNPTSAQCQCVPPTGSSCLANPSESMIADVWILIYGEACPEVCISCGAMGGNGTYDPINYLFTCDCTY